MRMSARHAETESWHLSMKRETLWQRKHLPVFLAKKSAVLVWETDRADQAIARIEVVSGSGTVVAGADFDSHEVHWKPVVPAGEKCYFVLVYNASKPETPVAYAAPVWIEP